MGSGLWVGFGHKETRPEPDPLPFLIGRTTLVAKMISLVIKLSTLVVRVMALIIRMGASAVRTTSLVIGPPVVGILALVTWPPLK